MPKSALILIVDRLGAGYLGPYGATWIETPALCELAAQSLLAENCLADAPELPQACRAFWTGRHAGQPLAAEERAQSLPRLALAAGAPGTLLTDEPLVAELPLAGEFETIELLRRRPATAAADSPQATALADGLDAVLDWLTRRREPFLLWVHLQGLAGPWDAPYASRADLADEDDPPPPHWVLPPELRSHSPFDPDLLLGYQQAYAAQVRLCDQLLGDFLAQWAEHPLAAETTLALASPRGYPLGEHGRIGPCDQALYSELLHVPLLLRLPRGEGALLRLQHLAQTCDLAPTIAEACGWLEHAPAELAADWRWRSLLRLVRGEASFPRDCAVALAPGQAAIRTPAWFAREATERGEPSAELFVKPDDYWEVNEVASRCGEILTQLSAAREGFCAAAAHGRQFQLPSLAAELRDVWR